MQKQLTDKNARYFYDWQAKERQKEELPDYCIKTLDRVKQNAKSLERKEKNSNSYKNTLRKLQADKEKFYRQLYNFKNHGKSRKQNSCFDMLPFLSWNITRYTFPAWKKSQGGNEDNYQQLQYPHQLLDFLYHYVEDADLIQENGEISEANQDLSIKVVTIGEEYYDWLENEQKEDTSESRLQFINTVSDEQAYELLQKYHMDHTYSICAIPLVFFYPHGIPQVTRWKLSADVKTRIKNLLTDVYGEGNFYFPGVVIKADTIKSDENRFYELADRYFNNCLVSAYRYETQYHDEYATGAFACIPFVIRYQHPSAVYYLKDIAYSYGNDGKDSLLLNPSEVYFRELYSGDEYQEEAFLASVSFADYQIKNEVEKDLSAGRGSAIFFEYWDDLHGLDLFFENLLEYLDGLNR